MKKLAKSRQTGKQQSQNGRGEYQIDKITYAKGRLVPTFEL